MKANLLKGDIMDIQAQVKTMQAANELQATANGLQQKMIDEIKTNNRVTSTHNKIMIGLTAAIVFLALISLFTNYNKPGRYAMSDRYVLDTKTSQLWLRATSQATYFGTNENPTFERTRQEKVKSFEEIE